jgi:FkbM family methyltransferase
VSSASFGIPGVLGEEIQDVFQLKDAAPSAGAVVAPGDETVLTTPVGQWHFALTIPPWSLGRDTPADLSEALILIEADLQVLEGEVGVGSLDRDGSTFLAETIVRSSMGRNTARLLFSPLHACSALVIRNVSAVGASRAEIFGVRAYRLQVPRLPDPPAILDGPSDMAEGPMANWSRFYGTALPDLESQLRLHELKELRAARIMRWLWGLKIIIDPSTETGRAVFLSGRYEPTTMYVVQLLLRLGDCFVDIGANAGLFSLAAAAFVGSSGQVIAFEPSSREYASLLANLKLNGLSHVTSVQSAIGEAVGHADLKIAESLYSGHNTLMSGFAYESVASTKIERVPVTTLDSYASDRNLARVDAIKVDVEGAELMALRGARRILTSLRPILIIEVFDQALRKGGASAEDVRLLLRDLGYFLWEIDDATGALSRGATLPSSDSSNMVAIPEERVNEVSVRLNARVPGIFTS